MPAAFEILLLTGNFYLLVECIASIAALIILFLIQIFQVIYGTDPESLPLF